MDVDFILWRLSLIYGYQKEFEAGTFKFTSGSCVVIRSGLYVKVKFKNYHYVMQLLHFN